MKKLLSLAFLFLLVLTSQSTSKSLPPGSGTSIPANILILLDRTFSMNNPANISAGSHKMKEPMAVVQDSTHGHYWVAEIDNGGIIAWNDTPNEFAPYGKINSVSANGCRTSSPWGANSGQNSKSYRDNVVNIEEYNGMLYMAHLKNDSINYSLVSQIDPRTTARLDTSRPHLDRICVHQIDQVGFASNHLAIDIQGDTFYAMGGGRNGLGTAFLWVKDLSLDDDFKNNTNWACSTNFSNGTNYAISGTGSDLHTASKFVTAITADSNNDYLYVANSSDSKIWSFKITSGCVSETKTAAFVNPCGESHGLVTDPLDSTILYSAGTYSHKICKIEVNNGNIVSEIDSQGIADAFEPSVPGKLYLMEPRSISFNQAGELVVANRGRLEVVIINKNLEFQRVFGLSGVSKLRGAVEAIKAVVSDSALTEGAQIGLGLWSHSSNAVYTGWNAAKDQGDTCTTKNCLVVKIDEQGANKIFQYLQKPISLYRATHANAFSRMAESYFKHPSDSPWNASLTCQVNYVIVIGDGGWSSGTHSEALGTMSDLADDGIKSIMVAFGNEILGNTSALNKFDQMAAVGQSPYTESVKALTAEDLKTELKLIIATITSENLSYTAPAITGSIAEGGTLYQAQFDYFATKEWQGSLKKVKVEDLLTSATTGVPPTPVWKAEDRLITPSLRNIWTSHEKLPSSLKNFSDTYADDIHTKLFQLTGNHLRDYHNDSGSITGVGRCGTNGDNVASVQDGVLDDAAGLINFIRGEDYLDYDGDCNLTETRPHYLADIYNSQIVMVGKPSADTAFMNSNQESFFRHKKGYQAWADSIVRDSVIYAGANNGILHAFNADTGDELWGFVPPLLVGNLAIQMNPGLNKTSGGGSVPIYGVDGSPVVHDMWFTKPGGTGEAWHSILMVPYGRGGAGFSVLDVTNPLAPEHLYSILNHAGTVYRSDHDGKIHPYKYKGNSYGLYNFEEIITVNDNFNTNPSVSQTCNNLGNTSCYVGNTLTIKNVVNIDPSADIKIYLDGNDVTGSATTTQSGPDLIIKLGSNITYSADETSGHTSNNAGITITNPMPAAGAEYDYRYLGNTMSSPRIFRLPNDGAGDAQDEDDIYVAVMGGGLGAPFIGSNLLVINLENGKLLKQIDIPDLPLNGIANAVPATPIVITPDQALQANYRGALVYVNDLEGKITKVNLTNMEDDRAQGGAPTPISLYDTTTLFSANSTSSNNRYMYHGMEATIGGDTNNLWLYSGTGNYRNLNDTGVATPNDVDNLLIGIKDKYFPNYKNITSVSIDGLTKCKDTTHDTPPSPGANCPQTADLGWYIKLEPDATSERRKVTAEPTISNGKVYFPVYKPATSSQCALGDAYVCGVDDECGTNSSSLLGTNTGLHASEECFNVGQGALSKIIAFNSNLYANIAGETNTGPKDLLILKSLTGDTKSLRLNWKENF